MTCYCTLYCISGATCAADYRTKVPIPAVYCCFKCNWGAGLCVFCHSVPHPVLPLHFKCNHCGEMLCRVQVGPYFPPKYWTTGLIKEEVMNNK